MTNSKINSFSGEFSFLSNFYECLITLDGKEYSSTEHAFQAAKTLLEKERSKIRKADTPGKAKRLGKLVKLRKDWESVKVGVMRELVLQKFTRHQDLREKLLATGDAELIEGNTWGDRYWGTVDGQGKNWLGKILMEVRKQL